ncbi:DUF3037 domain-containing protein [Nocardioides insulae]|uniref:DUF3037 domain-containing protein n=1 Tax=Nocardioides insulae TaxID=394734 RepID=UPI000429E0BD|nr:DUF3037 domain-containing protein [Nocardioides insulae]
MSARLSYQYVVLRCVPRVDREEFLNVGVVLYCEAAGFLRVGWRVSADRLSAAFPTLDVDQVCEALAFVDGVCAGDARGGAAAQHPLGQRFGFVRAPKSTVLQPGPVHGGVAADPEAELQRLVEQLVS